MIGARRGRYFHDGVEVIDLHAKLRELTEGKTCYLCAEADAGGALMITRKDKDEQDAPAVPVCQGCMESKATVSWIHEKLEKEQEEGKLSTLPQLHLVPGLIFRTDRPEEDLKKAFAPLPIRVEGGIFEILEEDHQHYYKPDGTASVHYFKETGHVLMVETDGCEDSIIFFSEQPWSDIEGLMLLIHEAEKDAGEHVMVKDVAEWLKELVWLRIQNAITKRKTRDSKRQLASVLLPILSGNGMIEKLQELASECNCPDCRASREKAREDEAIH